MKRFLGMMIMISLLAPILTANEGSELSRLSEKYKELKSELLLIDEDYQKLHQKYQKLKIDLQRYKEDAETRIEGLKEVNEKQQFIVSLVSGALLGLTTYTIVDIFKQ